jgi:hypothetical protein
MKLLYQISILLVAITLSSSVFGQELTIKGEVKERNSENKLNNCLITIHRDGQEFKTIDTGNSNRYNIHLDLGYNYSLSWAKDGYISMSIEVDTRNIPEADKKGGFHMDLPCALYKMTEGFNLNIFNAPVAKSSYNVSTHSFGFDAEYGQRMLTIVEAEFKRLSQQPSQH